MTPFDFSVQTPNGNPLPLFEKDFMFGVIGTSLARVDARGINCGRDATLQLTKDANVVELDVLNGSQTAVITAWSFGTNGWQASPPKSVPSMPGLQQHIRFDFANILRITFKSHDELYLHTIR
jgi:hypothetical protein